MNDVKKNFIMLQSVAFVDKLEFYLVPICFSLGMFGNSLGTICLFSKSKMRKRTPLFVLSCVGVFDSIFLWSQFQRWLATNFGSDIYLNTSSLCKLYFMLMRSSLIISISLIFCMITARFIRFFKGNFRLSTYSNTGQMCSHLCVAYIFALGLSLSWHPLWTSGIRFGSNRIYDIFYNRNQSKLISVHAFTNQKIFCSKNVDSIRIVDTLNTFYFLIGVILSILLVVIPLLIFLKVKHGFFSYDINLNEINYQNENSHGQDSNYENQANDRNVHDFEIRPLRNSKAINKGLINFAPTHTIRTFSWYIILICLISSLFCLPFFIFDQLFYSDANVVRILNTKIVIYNQSLSKIQEIINDYNTKRKNSLMSLIFNENLKNEELVINKLFLEAFTRLPLILINVPHMIKFYILLFFYSRFRHELCLMLRMRFYFNSKLARKINWFNSNSKTDLDSSDSQKPSNQNSIKDDNLENIEMIVVSNHNTATTANNNNNNVVKLHSEKLKIKHQFNTFWCFSTKKTTRPQVKAQKTQVTENFSNYSENSHKKETMLEKGEKQREIANLDSKKSIKTILLTFDSDEETENTSIVGYKSMPNSLNFNQIFV